MTMRKTGRIRVQGFGAVMIGIALISGVPSVARASGVLENWTGDVFAGYSLTNGNTQKSAANLSAQADKKEDGKAYQLKGSMTYSETNNSMDGQKWDILGKYSYDFGRDNKWFNLYQVLVDHDYFADIDYRVTPSLGVGYHIATTEDWMWDVDGGLGYRMTRYRSNKSLNDEYVTAFAHTFMKKKVFEKAFLSEDLTAYPGLKSGTGVVVRSETAFTNSLSEKLDLEIKYIVDFNSEPAADKKKTDTQLVAGLKYRF